VIADTRAASPLTTSSCSLVRCRTPVERIALLLRGGRGTETGRRLGDVERLTRLEVVGLRPGSVVLELDLARDQRALEGLDLGEEAVKTLVDGLDSLVGQEALPRGWDAGALLAWREATALYRRGVEGIEIAARLPATVGASGSLPPSEAGSLAWSPAPSRLLDTDVFSYIAKGDIRAEPFRPFLEGNLLCLSFATVAGIYKGFYRARWTEERWQGWSST
jgi:hypothetical protein